MISKVSFPNLLVDKDSTWDVVFELDHRRTNSIRNFRFGDETFIASLGLPFLGHGDRFELVKLGSGPYSDRRANASLTATRELELRPAR